MVKVKLVLRGKASTVFAIIQQLATLHSDTKVPEVKANTTELP